MRKLILLILLAFSPSNVWAATITSKAITGNLSTATNWVGDVAPISGDDIVIVTGANITVDADILLGADGASGTFAVVMQGTGQMTIPSGVTLTLRGGVSQQRGTTLNIVGRLLLDPNTGVQYDLSSNSTGSGSASIVMSGNSTSNRAVLEVSTRGGVGTIASGTLYTQLTVTNGKFVNMGAAAVNAVYIYMFVTTSICSINNLLLVDCGKLVINTVGGTQTLRIDGISFVGRKTQEIFSVTAGTAPSGVDRYIKKLTSYREDGSSPNTILLNANTINTEDWVLHNTSVYGTTNWKNSTHKRNFLLRDAEVSSGQYSFYYNSNNVFEDSLSLQHKLNPHHVTETSTSNSLTANQVKNNVFDGDGYLSGDSGDCVVPSGEIIVSGNIYINKSGTMAVALRSTAIVNAYNNTGYDAFGIQIGETIGGDSQAKLVKNNLFVSQPTGVHQLSAFVSQTNFTLKNNAYWDMTTDGNIDFAGNNTYMGAQKYASWWSSGSYGDADKGSGDIYITPMFHDPTRTIRNFGGWVSVQDVAREMVTINGADYLGAETTPTTKTIQDILDYIRVGFTPQNMGLGVLGDGDTYIGAVRPQNAAPAMMGF